VQDKIISVLIIDDNESLVSSVAAGLELDRFTVRTALDGKNGRMEIKEHQPDLLIIDVNLPDVNGFDLCKEVRKNVATCAIPIIMITGDQTIDIDKGFAVGADDCIMKPIDLKLLSTRIRKLIQEKQKEHVLVVEDDRQICDILLSVLSSQKYDVEVASDGTLIDERIKDNRPDLILLDITLHVPPDGIELCRQVKSNPDTKDIPVIMLTGNDNVESVEKCFGYGAEDYIFKPFNTADLVVKVKKYLAISRKKQYNKA
jgi:DNA-binding response OmpR family regulator